MQVATRTARKLSSERSEASTESESTQANALVIHFQELPTTFSPYRWSVPILLPYRLCQEIVLDRLCLVSNIF